MEDPRCEREQEPTETTLEPRRGRYRDPIDERNHLSPSLKRMLKVGRR